MSHMVKATCDVTDFDCLKRVCEKLGIRNYWTEQLSNGTEAFIIPHCWHNLVFYSDGRVTRDDMDMRLDSIKQTYSELKVSELAILSGMTVERIEGKNGSVILTLTKIGGG